MVELLITCSSTIINKTWNKTVNSLNFTWKIHCKLPYITHVSFYYLFLIPYKNFNKQYFKMFTMFYSRKRYIQNFSLSVHVFLIMIGKLKNQLQLQLQFTSKWSWTKNCWNLQYKTTSLVEMELLLRK